jgi:SAM-dependent methyltransferase
MRAGSPTPSLYAGLFLVTLATVMYEILLTRIFSVTMWYHFAFVAISLAMFGMAVGALVVYLRPARFGPGGVERQLGLGALLFALTIGASFLTHLSVPFTAELSIVGLYSVAFTYTVMAVPFVCSGICVCLALTRYPRHVTSLYAADLLGAAAGCLLVIVTLDATDGPTAVVAAAALAGLGAVCFLARRGSRLRAVAVATTALLVAFVVVNTLLVQAQSSLLRVRWVKEGLEAPPLYERWNAFSRITVFGDPRTPTRPMGWGLSASTPVEPGVRQLTLSIDSGVGTLLTAFDGDLRSLEHLRYDVTNLPHYLRRDASVLVIGAGGGRDILSALVFEQTSVIGVELNQDIIAAVNVEFGNFTGHLDRHPRVRFVADEARSWVARQQERFDVIQISLIDTFAATAAGAFVLSENSLYTREAWRLLLDRLTPRGVLAVSRWYFRDRPDEMYRLTSLASAALMDRGVHEPRPHVVIARQIGRTGDRLAPVGVATMLVSPAPFAADDLDVVETITRKLGFDTVLTPRAALDPTFARLASGKDLEAFMAAFPVNIVAPTDDSPFFFHTLRLRNAFSLSMADNINMKAVGLLGALLATVLALTVLCIVVPLFLTADRQALRGSGPLFVFFAAIGLGFMLVEVSQMQRLIIFLGHPTYGLSVVLFALLVSSGIGSMLYGAIARHTVGHGVLAFLLVVLVLFGFVAPLGIHAFQGSTTPVRILVAGAMLMPLGLFMGVAFPLGMRLASARSPTLTPWLWGINGATSVCASVLAAAIALGAGIAAAFWTGVACYVVAFVGARRLAISPPATNTALASTEHPATLPAHGARHVEIEV